MLITEQTMNDATPVVEYTWTGTTLLVGKPPEVSQCYSNPNKINLTGAANITGNLPWANLPSNFTWQEPVATAASLPTGIAGEARVVLNEDAIYVWDADLATPAWTKISGLVDFEEVPIGEFGVMDWTTLATEGLANTHLLIAIPDGGTENKDRMVGLFVWREDWATPSWQRLNYCLPFEKVEVGKSSFHTNEPGTMWIRYSESEDNYYLVYTEKDGLASWAFPLIIDSEFAGSLNDALGYLGWYEEGVTEEIEPNYGYGCVRFNWDSKKFEYWDDTIATPAWVEVT
jgi:hypothetical protein